MTNKFSGDIRAGSTSVSVPILLRKTADSTELTGIASGSVTASYLRQGATRTAITVSALGSVGAAYSSGGWIEVDATNMPGVYRFDLPDAAVAAGVDWVVIAIKVATAFLFVERYNLDVAAISAGGAIKVQSGTGTDQIDLTGGKVDIGKISGSATAADRLEESALSIVSGAAITGTLSTTQMTTNLTEATNDHYNGRVVIWTSGALIGQASTITDYVGSSKRLDYNTVTDTPANGDTFIIV